MKRIKALAVLAAAVLFMLCACGKTKDEQDMESPTGSESGGIENMGSTENTGSTEDTGRAGIVDNNGTEEIKTLENIAENFQVIES